MRDRNHLAESVPRMRTNRSIRRCGRSTSEGADCRRSACAAFEQGRVARFDRRSLGDGDLKSIPRPGFNPTNARRSLPIPLDRPLGGALALCELRLLLGLA